MSANGIVFSYNHKIKIGYSVLKINQKLSIPRKLIKIIFNERFSMEIFEDFIRIC